MSRLQITRSPKDHRILVDGENFSRGYSIDFIALAKSGITDGGYFFLTCGCGEPGCSWLYDPIEVTSDKDRVYWHVLQPEPERWFVFTKSEYRKELKNMLTDIFNLSKRAASHIGCRGFDREPLRALVPIYDGLPF